VARISGVDLPRDKRVDIALRYIYGIGSTRAYEIVQGSGVEGGTKVRDLSEDEVSKIREFIDRTYKVEGDLRREVAQDIKRKIEIGSYQGVRHRRSLPVRGQRTTPTRGPARAPARPWPARRRPRRSRGFGGSRSEREGASGQPPMRRGVR